MGVGNQSRGICSYPDKWGHLFERFVNGDGKECVEQMCLGGEMDTLGKDALLPG